jgi:RNA polymerase sigma factor (sigma-70 family)
LTENGYGSFYRERFSKTVVMLIAMGASRADAEDATQEAMIAALRNWGAIDEPSAWLRTVACRSFWRMARSQWPVQSLDESGPERAGDIDPSGFTEQWQWVLDLLRTLPPEQRKVVALLTDGATCPEIAALTGKSPETVRSLLRHARKTLKELMESGDS